MHINSKNACYVINLINEIQDIKITLVIYNITKIAISSIRFHLYPLNMYRDVPRFKSVVVT